MIYQYFTFLFFIFHLMPQPQEVAEKTTFVNFKSKLKKNYITFPSNSSRLAPPPVLT